jgi:hypothetical protein
MCWLGIFWKPYVRLAVGSKWDDLIGVKEQAAVQWMISHVIEKGGDEMFILRGTW